MNTGKFKPKYAPIQIGEKINLWTVLEKGSFKHNQQRWLCRCECGNQKEVAQQHLRTGASSRCVKCVGKRHTERAAERYVGAYSSNRRTPHIKQRVDDLYEKQKGICSLCGKQLPPLDKCAWDHDHQTGEGRDLLHKGCNVFLGFIERDPVILERVAKYCEKYKIK